MIIDILPLGRIPGVKLSPYPSFLDKNFSDPIADTFEQLKANVERVVDSEDTLHIMVQNIDEFLEIVV